MTASRGDEIVADVLAHVRGEADTFVNAATEGYRAILADAQNLHPLDYQSARSLATLVRLQRAIRTVRGL